MGTSIPVVLALSLIVFAVSLHTTYALDSDQTSKIDEFMKALMQCNDALAVTLAVVHDGDTYTQGYGVTDLETEEEVTTNTLFDIGSVTKHFASVILGSLLDEHGYVISAMLILA